MTLFFTRFLEMIPDAPPPSREYKPKFAVVDKGFVGKVSCVSGVGDA
jgi:hypothetical protein